MNKASVRSWDLIMLVRRSTNSSKPNKYHQLALSKVGSKWNHPPRNMRAVVPWMVRTDPCPATHMLNCEDGGWMIIAELKICCMSIFKKIYINVDIILCTPPSRQQFGAHSSCTLSCVTLTRRFPGWAGRILLQLRRRWCFFSQLCLNLYNPCMVYLSYGY